MLRRATTGLRVLHRQCECLCFSHHPLTQRLQNPTYRCLFSSTSLSLSERESQSRLGNFQNPSSSSSSSSIREVKDDAFAEGEGYKKKLTTHVLSDVGDTARASNNDVTPAHVTRGRTRSLRPILIPPSFPSSQLLPVMSIHETSSSGDQNTETTDPSSSSTTTTVTLTGLPPNAVKADILLVFQQFGEVTRIFVQSYGRRADVVFADVHGVKRTLHAYAEKPLLIRGKEIIVFRKYTKTNGVSGSMDTNTDTPSRTTRTMQGRDDGAIFVSRFSPTTTQEELLEALEPFGKHEQFVMCSGSKYAYFAYSNKYDVEEILSVHQRNPITVRGQTLHIERTENRPYSPSPGILADALELGKPPDPATCSAILKELTRTVSRFNGSHNPSRVLWMGGLPARISRAALTNFWSRLGCVVDVRSSLNGFAHVEFASTEEVSRAVRQGAPHGFRYRQRMLDIDFAPWVFHVGPAYVAVYISGWPASDGRHALLQWAHGIPNIAEATVLPPFRGETRSDARSAFLRFETTDDARMALRMLNGRVGPGGETLHVGLSRPPAVHPNQMWRWVYEAEDMEKNGGGGEGGEACPEDEWGGLGFGTGKEE